VTSLRSRNKTLQDQLDEERRRKEGRRKDTAWRSTDEIVREEKEKELEGGKKRKFSSPSSSSPGPFSSTSSSGNPFNSSSFQPSSAPFGSPPVLAGGGNPSSDPQAEIVKALRSENASLHSVIKDLRRQIDDIVTNNKNNIKNNNNQQNPFPPSPSPHSSQSQLENSELQIKNRVLLQKLSQYRSMSSRLKARDMEVGDLRRTVAELEKEVTEERERGRRTTMNGSNNYNTSNGPYDDNNTTNINNINNAERLQDSSHSDVKRALDELLVVLGNNDNAGGSGGGGVRGDLVEVDGDISPSMVCRLHLIPAARKIRRALTVSLGTISVMSAESRVRDQQAEREREERERMNTEIKVEKRERKIAEERMGRGEIVREELERKVEFLEKVVETLDNAKTGGVGSSGGVVVPPDPTTPSLHSEISGRDALIATLESKLSNSLGTILKIKEALEREKASRSRADDKVRELERLSGSGGHDPRFTRVLRFCGGVGGGDDGGDEDEEDDDDDNVHDIYGDLQCDNNNLPTSFSTTLSSLQDSKKEMEKEKEKKKKKKDSATTSSSNSKLLPPRTPFELRLVQHWSDKVDDERDKRRAVEKELRRARRELEKQGGQGGGGGGGGGAAGVDGRQFATPLKSSSSSNSALGLPPATPSTDAKLQKDYKKRYEAVTVQFQALVQKYIEIVYSLTGWKISLSGEIQSGGTKGKVKARNVYAEREGDFVLFLYESEGLNLVESDFVNELQEEDMAYLNQAGSIPGFMSNLTMRLMEANTIM